ncbi:unnamed protein product [Blepharisma stoltei]|uniref:hydroxyacylglutathione hydrolase n=1 Tax=Blepharisma stoltei TaxID=1481888 RepID=A0AAU9JFU4_9CILI|nr:unnamed protein product [Blepharisma stoltei]
MIRKIMRIIPIKLFEDNYSYAVFVEGHNSYALVDPADLAGVKAFISGNPQLSSMNFTHVFTTHKHADHCGNNEQIAAEFPHVKIVGGASDGIPACNYSVQDQDVIVLDNGLRITALHTPCHTRGHILYYFEDYSSNDGTNRAVFTGDTIFIGGCGRFFEGNAEEMHAAMEKAKTLPTDTKVYCGHEYTESNLKWSAKVEHQNQAIQSKLEWAVAQRERGQPTVPSTIGEEMEINVFMRAQLLTGLLGVSDAVAAMARLREMKNSGQTLV